MSEPRLAKYMLEKDTLVHGNLIRKGSSVYLAADVDALLRQREEELAKAYQRANIAEANQRQLAGTVKEVHTLRAQLVASQARCKTLESALLEIASIQTEIPGWGTYCIELAQKAFPTERPPDGHS